MIDIDKLDWGNTDQEYIDLFKREILTEKTYERFFEVKEGDVVFDAGANIGTFTASILHKNPKHVFCVEPSNTLVKCLEKNLAGQQVTIINKAISDVTKDNEVIEEKGVFVYHNEGSTYNKIKFKDILEKYNIDRIDFLKFDCEGGEYNIFTEENYEFITKNVNYMVGEWHINDQHNAVERFIKFRDLYLVNNNNYRFFERDGKEVTHEIFDDKYLYAFRDWWKNTYKGQWIVYIDNTKPKQFPVFTKKVNKNWNLDDMNKNFVKLALENGGVIKPLTLPHELTNGTGLFNPSVFIDNGEILVNIRHCQYLFYHSEKKTIQHQWGPLVYLNPENDISLRTTNYLTKLNEDLEMVWYKKIDTSKLDVKPLWEFIGLEDIRLVRWDGILYGTGVRRDTTTNGQGRMELSTLEVTDNYVKETERWRIPAPGANDSYCEKNWMPILDWPYHYVKWSNPLEIVKVDPVSKTCETVILKQQTIPYYYRGGSQVIKWGKYWICLPHIVWLFRSDADKKDAIYRQGFIVWDEDWNIVRYTKPFAFMGADVEFCCGMAYHNGRILITFGYQDNAAFILSITPEFLMDYINHE